MRGQDARRTLDDTKPRKTHPVESGKRHRIRRKDKQTPELSRANSRTHARPSLIRGPRKLEQKYNILKHNGNTNTRSFRWGVFQHVLFKIQHHSYDEWLKRFARFQNGTHTKTNKNRTHKRAVQENGRIEVTPQVQ